MNRRTWILPAVVLAVLVLSQSACSLAESISGEVVPEAVSEAGAENVQAEPVEEDAAVFGPGGSGETVSEPGAGSPGGQQVPPQNQNAPPAQQGSCSNHFEIDGSALLQPGTQLEPGETFEAGWTLRNTGSCTWDSGYELVQIGGDDMDVSSLALNTSTAPGDTITLQLELAAPSQDGTYLSAWKLEAGTGQRFGMDSPANAPLRVSIEVISSGSTSSNPPVIAAPYLDLSSMPNVYANGIDRTLSTSQCFDFEDGAAVSCSSAEADFRFNFTTGQGGELAGLNGTRFSSTFNEIPGEDELQAAAYYSDPAPLPESGPTGRYFGLTTEIAGKNAYGWLLPTSYNAGGLTFSYLVYEPDTVTPVQTIPELNLSLFILISEEQETMMADRCYDFEAGTKASCSGSDADIKYTFSSGTGTLQFLNGSEQSIGDDETEPDKATCQADSYMGGYNFIHEAPADYNCFTTIVDGDQVYGWYRVTAYNSSGMTFDYLLWQP